jgi:hypothetical protein
VQCSAVQCRVCALARAGVSGTFRTSLPIPSTQKPSIERWLTSTQCCLTMGWCLYSLTPTRVASRATRSRSALAVIRTHEPQRTASDSCASRNRMQRLMFCTAVARTTPHGGCVAISLVYKCRLFRAACQRVQCFVGTQDC